MGEQLKFDVFISYRRDGGEVMGRLLFELLKDNYNVFFDHESLSSGRFDKKILEVIKDCNDVVFLLSKGCFDRCGNENDWFMQEIDCAVNHDKNIMLLLMEDFEMPVGAELLQYPEGVQKLVCYNGYKINIAHVDGVVAKLESGLKTPKKEKVSPVDSVSEWNEFARCLSNPKYVSLLPEELKMKILRGSVESFLDEWNGKIFTSILDRMTGQTYNIRTKFRYEIDVNEGFNFRGLEIDEEKYYELSETFSYSKKFLKGAPDKVFWLSFTTNLDELDAELRNENFFFSENLLMDREDIRLLSEMEEEEKEDFYLSVMRVRINVNGKVLSPVKVVIDESGVFGKYEMEDEVLTASETFDVKLRFRIPQRDGDGFFFASISEPTYSPFIRFSYPEDAYDVTMIPFLNRSVTAKDTKIFEGVRELSVENEWVIPVSGVIFMIKKIENK
ncbi:MAG: toll/interleukin-1 receptor domain-containing protein [Clostridia bacterium]|nr:toll/interleukin-1 receptor domain-containing protein [Clostridia bacterium]